MNSVAKQQDKTNNLRSRLLSHLKAGRKAPVLRRAYERAKGVLTRMKRDEAAGYPKGLPSKYRYHWRKPWTLRARKSKDFAAWLNRRGYLTPHFRKEEAACKDGTFVPVRLIPNARKHAFNLERLRHRLGDKPVQIISWYRTPDYNKRVGGASLSQHVNALATDHPVQWVRRFKDFDRHARIVFRVGGFGTYPAGNRHLDSRGWFARWSSY